MKGGEASAERGAGAATRRVAAVRSARETKWVSAYFALGIPIALLDQPLAALLFLLWPPVLLGYAVAGVVLFVVLLVRAVGGTRTNLAIAASVPILGLVLVLIGAQLSAIGDAVWFRARFAHNHPNYAAIV